MLTSREKMAAIRKDPAIVNVQDRVCENIDLAKVAAKMVSWERYAPYCGLSPADEIENKQDSEHYVVQKLRMLERWKEKSGKDATYTNLAVMFEGVGDPVLANLVRTLAQDQGETEIHDQDQEGIEPNNQDPGGTEPDNQDQEGTEPHNQDPGGTEPDNQDQEGTEPDNRNPGGTEPHSQEQRETKSHKDRNYGFSLLFGLTSYYTFLYQPVKHPMPENYTQYVNKVKQQYKTHLHDVAQSFWLPANMHKFIQLSLTSRDKPHDPKKLINILPINDLPLNDQ